MGRLKMRDLMLKNNGYWIAGTYPWLDRLYPTSFKKGNGMSASPQRGPGADPLVSRYGGGAKPPEAQGFEHFGIKRRWQICPLL